jgi:hypothetical protein
VNDPAQGYRNPGLEREFPAPLPRARPILDRKQVFPYKRPPA